ncbi:MAG: 30S ribosomal protein S4 [Candidatus Woesearchaeota archaeon]
MGDIKKQRKKFDKPFHPWQKARLDTESVVVKEYALKNKKELWKMQSRLKHFTSQAKKLTPGLRGETERNLLLSSLRNLGVVSDSATIDDVLNLTLKDILEKRLQTFVFRKGFSRSMKQARQFIVHKHVMVGSKVVGVPSYLVLKSEESAISFRESSALASVDHPERVAKTEPKEKKVQPKKEPVKRKPRQEKKQ